MNHMERRIPKEITLNPVLSRVLGISLFVLLTALGAFVRIPLPFTPVPITMQTLFVLLSGLFLGKRDGSLSQIVYLSLGFIGLPIFATGSGATYLLGPTAGYLLGFAIAPYIVGLIADQKSSYVKIALAMIAGEAAIHSFGIINLSFFLKINLFQAFVLGSLPFIPGAILKAAAGSKAFLVYKKAFKK